MLKEIEEMICFAAICDEGSITRAAKILECSKSQVSRKISHMEERYAIKLFHRTTRSIKPTDAALKLKRDALQLYYHHKKLKYMAKQIHQDLAGDFVITAPSSMSAFLLAPLLPKLKTKFPKINFKIIVSNRTLDLVENGIDLAIRSRDVVDENLVARQVGSSKEKLYVNKKYFKKISTITTPIELNKHDLIINPYSINDNTITLDNGLKTVPIAPINYTEINHYQIILNVIENSDGVAALPQYAASRSEKAGNIINILPEWHTNQWPIFLVNTFQMPIPKKLEDIRNYISIQLPFISDIFTQKV